MKSKDIIHLRLLNQKLMSSKFKTIKELAGWMGAFQAQDFPMARWALGIRSKGSDQRTVTKAVDNGEIIRTHLLRPTWHIVSSSDIYWILELTAPQIIKKTAARHKQLELTPAILRKSNSLIEKLLQKKEDITSEEIAVHLQDNKIITTENRLAHLLMHAELSGIICSGKVKKNRQTYTLLERKVKANKSFSREEALAKIAQIYFRSHGPAAFDDFVWWSGLNINDARIGFNSILKNLKSAEVDLLKYYYYENGNPIKNKSGVYFLPAYDEFIISYKHRDILFDQYYGKKIISMNGIFKPVLLINGNAAGTWKRIFKKSKVIIEADLFQQPDRSVTNSIYKSAELYGAYLNNNIEFEIKNY